MHHGSSIGTMLGLLELAVPFYGLRLNRSLGTRQIGWGLVVAFSALALVRVFGVSFRGASGQENSLWILIYALVPVLLLIGMAHMELLHKERRRAERALDVGVSMARSTVASPARPHFEVMAQVAAAAAQHFNRHLAVINVYARLLRQKSFDSRTAEHHKRIAEEAERAAALGKRLLSTGRSHPIRQMPVSLNKLIFQQLSVLRQTLGQETALENDCRHQVPPVLVDREHFAFMLEQVVRNATEAGPPGSPISIGAELVQVDAHHSKRHNEARPGRFVRVTVADSGCGMSDQIRERIFEPFFTTKDRSAHAGLGLASVHGLILEHGGWIEVQSRVGRGTRVEMFFPVVS